MRSQIRISPAGILLAGAALCWSPAVLAQSADANAPDAPADEAEEVDDAGVPVIVVTANKRAQSIQDVPVSVVALQPEKLEQAGIVSTADHAKNQTYFIVL